MAFDFLRLRSGGSEGRAFSEEKGASTMCATFLDDSRSSMSVVCPGRGLLLFMTSIKNANRGKRTSAEMTKLQRSVGRFAARWLIRHIGSG